MPYEGYLAFYFLFFIVCLTHSLLRVIYVWHC